MGKGHSYSTATWSTLTLSHQAWATMRIARPAPVWRTFSFLPVNPTRRGKLSHVNHGLRTTEHAVRATRRWPFQPHLDTTSAVPPQEQAHMWTMKDTHWVACNTPTECAAVKAQGKVSRGWEDEEP